MGLKRQDADSPYDGRRFEATVMMHLDAAYNLALWLTRDDHQADDIVQEACLRALKYLDTFRGGHSRAWFLSIVRNVFYDGLKKSRHEALNVPLDGDGIQANGPSDVGWLTDEADDVSRGLERDDAKRVLNQALDRLPPEFREIIVLRYLEDLSYRDIARIAHIPLGTVMSRLSRGRKLLFAALQHDPQEP